MTYNSESVPFEQEEKTFAAADTRIPEIPAFPGHYWPGDRPELPDELEDCVVEAILGKGGVGDVYQLSRTIRYAIKVIEWNDKSSRPMAQHEYETAAMFSECDYVIRYHKYYEKGNKSFLLQELGQPWYNCRGFHKVQTGDVLNMILDACRALSFIHAKGYQHFDVKPQNILFAGKNAKLGDFSHTYPFEKGKQFMHRMGTYQFMAPEMALEKLCSGTEDIYSLGITMFFMLRGGRLPYDYSKRFPHVRHEEDEISTLFLHEDLLEIVKKATAFDPDQRYQAVEEMQEAIELVMKTHEDAMEEMILVDPNCIETTYPWATCNYHSNIML
ncbi:MAG: serine/threonine protein kinase [Blautia sp.]|nr:serine/threonine protein kinase [Blautia sp.]